MKAAVGALAVMIGLPLVLAVVVVVVIMVPQGADTRRSAAEVCTRMLGAPPAPESTVLTLGGPEADAVAAQWVAAARTPLTGAQAYRFVSTLHTLINWRRLPPAEVAAWAGAADPVATPPAGAELEAPWPAPELTTDQNAQLAATLERAQSSPDSISVADYETACAVVLRRIDVATAAARATSATLPSSSTLPTAVAAISARRAAVVEAVTARLGTAVTDAELWQLISPTPDSDPRQTLLSALAIQPDAVVSVALPGDLVCYDFTTSGPTRCGLITTAEPSSMAVIGADGMLSTGPIPSNSTIFRPV